MLNACSNHGSIAPNRTLCALVFYPANIGEPTDLDKYIIGEHDAAARIGARTSGSPSVWRAILVALRLGKQEWKA